MAERAPAVAAPQPRLPHRDLEGRLRRAQAFAMEVPSSLRGVRSSEDARRPLGGGPWTRDEGAAHPRAQGAEADGAAATGDQ